jgi:hypothetical protein
MHHAAEPPCLDAQPLLRPKEFEGRSRPNRLNRRDAGPRVTVQRRRGVGSGIPQGSEVRLDTTRVKDASGHQYQAARHRHSRITVVPYVRAGPGHVRRGHTIRPQLGPGPILFLCHTTSESAMIQEIWTLTGGRMAQTHRAQTRPLIGCGSAAAVALSVPVAGRLGHNERAMVSPCNPSIRRYLQCLPYIEAMLMSSRRHRLSHPGTTQAPPPIPGDHGARPNPGRWGVKACFSIRGPHWTHGAKRCK